MKLPNVDRWSLNFEASNISAMDIILKRKAVVWSKIIHFSISLQTRYPRARVDRVGHGALHHRQARQSLRRPQLVEPGPALGRLVHRSPPQPGRLRVQPHVR